MVDKKPQNKKGPRLAYPARYENLLPKIHWALLALRQSEHITWLMPGRDVALKRPFMNQFDDDTVTRIKRLAKLNRVSLSTVISTALKIYDASPKLADPDRGLRKDAKE